LAEALESSAAAACFRRNGEVISSSCAGFARQHPYRGRLGYHVDDLQKPVRPAGVPDAELDKLIAEAARDLSEYQRLTSEGKLGEAGQKLEQLKAALDPLSSRRTQPH
jgi:hypothetical protein